MPRTRSRAGHRRSREARGCRRGQDHAVPAPRSRRAVATSSRWGIVRIVLVLGVGLGLALPTLLIVAWFVFAGGRFGWITTSGSFALLTGLVSWLAFPSSRAATRTKVLRGLVPIAAVAGIATAHFAPPTEGRLRHEVEEIALPGWELVDDSVSGNAACFDYCTSVAREYRVDAPADVVLEQLEPALESRGLTEVGHTEPGRTELADDVTNEISVRVTVVSNRDGTTTVYISASA